MNKNKRYCFLVAFLFFAFIIWFLVPGLVRAQSSSSWSQCADGKTIVRCETYDCPKGDTNGDGRCTSADTNAKVTDARNDAFCANPISGCGQVLYYPAGSSSACLERVEEAGNNCDLYAVVTPTFTPLATSTPIPTPTPKPTQMPTASPSASPSATPVVLGKGGGGDELPKTGPEHIWIGIFVLTLGASGVFLYEKYKTI